MDWPELFDYHEYTKLFVALLALSTPLAAAPVFVSLTARLPSEQKVRVARIAPLAFVAVLWVNLLFGSEVLAFFGVTVPAFRVAGGLLLLLTGIEMLRSSPHAEAEAATPAANAVQLAFVPLAVPLTAGPGAITAVIVFGEMHEGLAHLLLVGSVVLAVGAVLWLVLHSATWLTRVAGDTAMLVVNRLMGLIVTSVGAEFVLDGIAQHFPELFGFAGH